MCQSQECERSCAGVYVCVYNDLVHSRDVAKCEDRLSKRQILPWLFRAQTHLVSILGVQKQAITLRQVKQAMPDFKPNQVKMLV